MKAENMSPDKIFEKIRDVIAIWSVGSISEKVGGSLTIKFLGEKGEASAKYNISIRRVFVKERFEARGYIKVDINAKYKPTKISLIDLGNRKLNILINMRYYLFATNKKFSKDLVRFIDSFLNKGGGLTYIVPPPYIPYFLANLVEKINSLRQDIQKIFEVVNPINVEFVIKITTRRPKIFLGEIVGRVIKIIVDEFSNISNWSELRRRISRYSGFNEEDLDEVISNWRLGVIEMSEMTISYLKILGSNKYDFLEGLKHGMGIQEDSEFKRIMRMFVNFVKDNLDKDYLDSLNSILREIFGENYFSKDKFFGDRDIKSCLLKGVNDGDVKRLIGCVKNFGLERIFGEFRDMLINESIDKDRVLASILLIADKLNMSYSRVWEFLKGIDIGGRSLAGSFLKALDLLNCGSCDDLKDVLNDLFEKISNFSYSIELKSYPYRVLVAKSYELLSILFRRFGDIDRAKLFKEMAKRVGLR